MKIFIVLVALFGYAVASAIIPVTKLIRTPEHDTAVITDERIGGNFAYSTVEGHAFKELAPIVQKTITPVAVKYTGVPVSYGVPVHTALPYSAPLHTPYTTYSHIPYSYSHLPYAYHYQW